MTFDDSGEVLGPQSVWLRMASTLLAADGPRILERSMRADVADGVATITRIETHTMSESAYEALVQNARLRLWD